jgi:hypothetical protein
MAYILRRVLVDDAEEAKRGCRETAALRRHFGVAHEQYFTNSQRPQELVIAYDGETIDQLGTALRIADAVLSGEAPPPALGAARLLTQVSDDRSGGL